MKATNLDIMCFIKHYLRCCLKVWGSGTALFVWIRSACRASWLKQLFDHQCKSNGPTTLLERDLHELTHQVYDEALPLKRCPGWKQRLDVNADLPRVEDPDRWSSSFDHRPCRSLESPGAAFLFERIHHHGKRQTRWTR
jgi:hypothetical protein